MKLHELNVNIAEDAEDDDDEPQTGVRKVTIVMRALLRDNN